ncbi:MAG: NADH-quinone oxidoreductase subunit N [Methylococcaceae bacterium]|nr:NADH-quinone oxidoreductase subunit N [Methylococcaceae bacterium]
MSTDALLALMPLIIMAASAIVVMLAIAIRRDFKIAFHLTLAGLLLTLATLSLAFRHGAMPVTDLLLIDTYSILACALIVASASVVALLCRDYFQRVEHQNEEIFVLLLTAVLGGMILVSSSHFALLFLGLEILSVSLFPMMAHRTSTSLEAGIKYLMLSGVSSAFLLFGMALIYGEFGVLSFRLLAPWAVSHNLFALTGFILILAALSFKLSLTPFHLWTADVYQGAPAPISTLVATVSKAAVFAFLLRFWVFTQAYRSEILVEILALIGAASVLVGNLLALRQTRLKRILAYSSIAHMGYLIIGFVAGSILQTGFLLETTWIYLAAYVLTNLGAFAVVSALSSDERECDDPQTYSALFRNHPWLAGIFMIHLFSLAGIPLTIGFIGKFYVFAASIDAGLWWLAGILVISSGMGIYYYLRVLRLMLLPGVAVTGTATPAMRWILSSLALLILGFGLFPQPLIQVIQSLPKP